MYKVCIWLFVKINETFNIRENILHFWIITKDWRFESIFLWYLITLFWCTASISKYISVMFIVYQCVWISVKVLSSFCWDSLLNNELQSRATAACLIVLLSSSLWPVDWAWLSSVVSQRPWWRGGHRCGSPIPISCRYIYNIITREWVWPLADPAVRRAEGPHHPQQ